MKIKFVLVSDLRREYSKNNTFAVNHIMFKVMYETVFRFLSPDAFRHRIKLLDGGLVEYFKKNQRFPWT
jgi:hypothetical protein